MKLTISRAVTTRIIRQGERGDVYPKIYIYYVIPFPVSRAKHFIPILMCLAAFYQPFLPNLWSSSAVSWVAQDDEIQQLSFLWDFWCLLTGSGVLSPTNPFLLAVSYLPFNLYEGRDTTKFCLKCSDWYDRKGVIGKEGPREVGQTCSE